MYKLTSFQFLNLHAIARKLGNQAQKTPNDHRDLIIFQGFYEIEDFQPTKKSRIITVTFSVSKIAIANRRIVQGLSSLFFRTYYTAGNIKFNGLSSKQEFVPIRAPRHKAQRSRPLLAQIIKVALPAWVMFSKKALLISTSLLLEDRYFFQMSLERSSSTNLTFCKLTLTQKHEIEILNKEKFFNN